MVVSWISFLKEGLSLEKKRFSQVSNLKSENVPLDFLGFECPGREGLTVWVVGIL